MSRQYSFPAGHWNWPVQLTHQHGVRSGNYIFTGGQAALNAQGEVQAPGDLQRQTQMVLGFIETILQDLDATASDIVKLICYFVGDASDELQLVDIVGRYIDTGIQSTEQNACKPVINTVCMPELCYPGMRVEIEAVAMKSANGAVLQRRGIRLNRLGQLHQSFSHIVQCDDTIFSGDISATESSGDLLFPDDVVRQTEVMMENLSACLFAIDAQLSDIVKVNVFYNGDGTAENWEKPALIRAGYFNEPGPAATGLSVPRFAQQGLMTKIYCTAMRSANGSVTEKSYAWPEGHWDWTTRLPYKHGNKSGQLIHLGGQVSLNSDSEVVDVDDMAAQTRNAMRNIETVLSEFGATLDHVVKVTSYYQGKASASDLHKNLLIRSGSYTKPGPPTTGIPIPCLVYENMLIEIEVIAMLDP